jgi:lipopolysaccharide/colanic/teichoic acid biosynthesis glycosyltransferase
MIDISQRLDHPAKRSTYRRINNLGRKTKVRSPLSDELEERTRIQYHSSWLRTSAFKDRLTRVADLLAAAALIALTLPLFIFVCLAIKLDSPGPVSCRQVRLGPDGRRFYMLKFRTIAPDPQRASRPIWGRGARETRIGPFLSYTRIEDLPQLINVLRGELRLVGIGSARSAFTG